MDRPIHQGVRWAFTGALTASQFVSQIITANEAGDQQAAVVQFTEHGRHDHAHERELAVACDIRGAESTAIIISGNPFIGPINPEVNRGPISGSPFSYGPR
jgi:hypothetical protein